VLQHPDPNILRLLNSAARQYEQPSFVPDDPIAIPHGFSRKDDIEIAGFLVATIAWGQRRTIVSNGWRLMEWMDHCPADFVCHASPTERLKVSSFVHRTFQPADLQAFIDVLRQLYTQANGLEGVFCQAVQPNDPDVRRGLVALRDTFYQHPNLPQRSRKHVPDIERGAAAKRINMFLRWMVRPASNGVDFGLWTCLKTSQLLCPLDVHSGRTARSLGLLHRTANDFTATIELTKTLRLYDTEDPVRYDFSLFGLSMKSETFATKNLY